MDIPIFVVVALICWMPGSSAQLSFVPSPDFYEIALSTDIYISCLYDGVMDSRVDWLEDGVVINSNPLNLSNISLGNHEFTCRFTPETGSIQTKRLTVNVYIPTQLQFIPDLANYTYSTQLTNSTPYYLYCLGCGHPSPDLEWREDSKLANISVDLALPGHSYDSINAIDLKQFPPGSHELSCFGFNGYTSAELALTLSTDSSSPLLVNPAPNTTQNDSLLYLLTDTYTNFSIHCSLKHFSLPLDEKWVGLSPVWTLFNDPTVLSNSSTVQLTNETLGELLCVLQAADNSTLEQKVHVTFVNAPTGSTSSTSKTSSTIIPTTTNSSSNTTASTSSTSSARTLPGDNDSLYLSPLIIALIIAGLFTLLCISVLILLSLGMGLVCGCVSKRARERRRRRCSRIIYLDVMDGSYPAPGSLQYSADTSVEVPVDISQQLGVRVPIYQRIQTS